MSDLPSVEAARQALKLIGRGWAMSELPTGFPMRTVDELFTAFADGRLVPVSRFVCSTCKGKGGGWHVCMHMGAVEPQPCEECRVNPLWEDCPACEGSGWVFPNDLIEAAVQAHAEAEGFISPHDDAWPAMRAALVAVQEWEKENR